MNLGILRFADNYRREWDAAKEALKDELLLPDYMCKSTLFFYNSGDRVTGIDVDWRKRDAATRVRSFNSVVLSRCSMPAAD